MTCAAILSLPEERNSGPPGANVGKFSLAGPPGASRGKFSVTRRTVKTLTMTRSTLVTIDSVG
jgi:hypothetical protein